MVMIASEIPLFGSEHFAIVSRYGLGPLLFWLNPLVVGFGKFLDVITCEQAPSFMNPSSQFCAESYIGGSLDLVEVTLVDFFEDELCVDLGVETFPKEHPAFENLVR